MNVDFKCHIGHSYYLKNEEMIFDGICWNNYEGEDPEEYNHEYDGRQFNHRDLERTRNYLQDDEFLNNNRNQYHRYVR